MSTDREPPMARIKSLVEAIERSVQQSDAPLVLGLAVVTLTLVFTTSRYLLFERPESFPLHAPDAINIALMIAAFMATAGLLLWQYCVKDKNPNKVKNSNPCTVCCSWFRKCTDRHKALEACERIAAVIFVIGALLFHIFRLMADLDCLGEWHVCREFHIERFHQVGAFRGLSQLLFMLSEFAFCLLFSPGGRPVNAWMLLGLGLVQCANFAMWFDALLDESEILPQNSTTELEKCRALFNISTFSTSKYVKCFKKHTKYYELEESASPYLYPLNTEFLLLAAKIIFDFLFVDTANVATCSDDNTPCVPAGGTIDAEANGAANIHEATNRQLSDLEDARDRHGENEPLLHPSGPENPETRDQSATGGVHCCFRPGLFKLSLFEAILGIILSPASGGAFLFFGSMAFYTEDKEYYWRDAFAFYRIGYWTVTILVTLVGYCIVPAAGSNPRPLERFEYFVVLCSVGLFAHILFTLIANVHTSDDTCPTGLFLAEEILNILQVLSQTAFYVYTAKVRENIGQQVTAKGAIYRAILFHFWISNLFMWLEDSFIETHNKEKFFQFEYYEHWKVIYNITNPVMMACRLNSMFLFASLYFSDRPKQEGDGHPDAGGRVH